MNIDNRALRSKQILKEGLRGFLAIGLSLLLIPYSQPSLYAQQGPPPPPPPQGNYAPLGAEQLNQLVAPVALYPDALVAQVLTAATYPQQIADANNWMLQTGNMPPDQRAAAADQMPWDPSVKALTAFPSVLSNMARNYNWTAALGNAYYNQPGDVMNSVQAMRMQAQSAGNLRTDAHYRVYDNAGLVVIEPVNPAFVYVPYYNPWAVYGGPVVPWGGYYWGGPPRGVVFAAGLGIGFAAGISIALFSHYGWGYHNWSPNWRGGVVVYNHTTYISRSTTVINRGNFGGYNRGVYEHAGPGVPRNFRPAVTAQSAAFRPGQSAPGGFRGSNYSNGRPQVGQTPQTGRQFGQPTPQVRQPAAPQNSQAGRQFGQQPRPQNQPTQPQGNYSRSQTYRPPAAGVSPQNNRPQNNPGTYRQQQQGNNGPRPQVSAPTHQPAAPTHQPAAAPAHQAAPSHQQGGGQRSQPHKDERR